MSYAAGAYILGLIGDAFLIFLSVYHVIAFDELKTDFKNPIDHCKLMNPLVLPEYGIHLFMTIIFLMCGEWITVLINIPLLAYNINRLYGVYVKAPKTKSFLDRISNLYDPTNIMNSDQLARASKEGWFKLFFNLFGFFYYIYGLITTLVAAES